MRRYTLEIKDREFVIDVQELTADRFQVTLDGEEYEVRLSSDEDLADWTITPQVTVTRPQAPVRVPSAPRPAGSVAGNGKTAPAPAAPAPRPAAPPAGGGGGKSALNAPMPGVILEVNVSPGETVSRGQVVAVLEAMKMKNAIKATRDGVIAQVCVQAGQAVGHGDAIVRFEEG